MSSLPQGGTNIVFLDLKVCKFYLFILLIDFQCKYSLCDVIIFCVGLIYILSQRGASYVKEGLVFNSFEEFSQTFTAYQQDICLNFNVVDSTTVERARKKQPKRLFRFLICCVVYTPFDADQEASAATRVSLVRLRAHLYGHQGPRTPAVLRLS